MKKRPVKPRPTPITEVPSTKLPRVTGGVTNGDDWGDASKFT